ncbi:hypothetical protein [Deinococcus peraridilitoris]|uniref:hypothetical protein n=1 Tax=Deinococcus peraridilitoris TaxID=432329 RepID=UPI0012FC6B53|nr:hypothetical protein [Deinococcus peraridilitoris]
MAQSPAPNPVRPAQSAPEATERVTRQGRSVVQQFYAVKIDSVWATFTPELRASLGSLAAFRAYREAGVREYGAETRVLSERLLEADGLRYYVRTAVFERHPGQAWSVIVGFDAKNRVAAFTILLAGELEEEEVRT